LGGLFVTRRDRWVAPPEDGGILIDPPLERVEELVETNRRRLENPHIRLLGKPLAEVRGELRAEGSHELPNYTDKPIIATGHQIELSHPGVLVKQFAVSGLARRSGCVPMDVRISSDTIKSTSVQFPSWPPEEPHLVSPITVPFDDWAGEESAWGRIVRNPERLLNFAEDSRPIWSRWPFTPLLPAVWPSVREAYESEQWLGFRDVLPKPASLSTCLRGASEWLQREFGCEIYPIVFHPLFDERFVLHIVRDLPRFHTIYNDAVRAYRRKYRLKSRDHPVPDLATDGEFLESPFWWYDGNTRRRSRLFVRVHQDRIDLRPGRAGTVKSVPWEGDETWLCDSRMGASFIFTRALTTTMFIRLCLSDLFIHGIGGAKYDEVTDDIIRRYFGIEPPEYMVVSGTLRLPFPTFPATPTERLRLTRKARDLRWHPEQFLDHENDLIQQKRRWLAREPLTRDEKRARYRELVHLTEALRPMVADQTAEVETQIERCDLELSANEILTRRDYPFVLYPESKLKPFLTQLL
jgi:hypothetical protein